MTDAHKKQKGFTLVELLVTISIFVFMTSVILSRYNNFNSGTLLTNVAYDMALAIKQAQTYGIGVKASNVSASNFDAAYGISFEKNSSEFTLFADNDKNGVYQAGDTEVEKYTLKRGAKVTKICLNIDGGCGNNGVNNLYVTFRRPNPNAMICKTPDPIQCIATFAEITISSADGVGTRMVRINKSGQISVQHSELAAPPIITPPPETPETPPETPPTPPPTSPTATITATASLYAVDQDKVSTTFQPGSGKDWHFRIHIVGSNFGSNQYTIKKVFIKHNWYSEQWSTDSADRNWPVLVNGNGFANSDYDQDLSGLGTLSASNIEFGFSVFTQPAHVPFNAGYVVITFQDDTSVTALIQSSSMIPNNP